MQDGTIETGSITHDTGKVTLKHGESIVFAEIPKGMAYEIVEASYSSTGYMATGTNMEYVGNDKRV